MYTEINSALVIDFWKFMANEYGSTTHDKRDSSFMKSIGSILNLMNILDKEKFLSNYATTIGTKIYTPFQIGQTSTKFSFENQIACCVHEHMHVELFKLYGFSYNLNYVLDHSKRAIYEAQAYTTNFEMYYYSTGELLDPDYVSKKILAYGCNNDDVAVVKKILESNLKTIKYGGIISRPSAIAIEWFENNLKK